MLVSYNIAHKHAVLLLQMKINKQSKIGVSVKDEVQPQTNQIKTTLTQCQHFLKRYSVLFEKSKPVDSKCRGGSSRALKVLFILFIINFICYLTLRTFYVH